MKRLIGSPLKILGLLTILLGLFVTILTYGYLIVVGLIFVGVGLALYLADFLVYRFPIFRKHFWRVQTMIAITYVLLGVWTYMKWQEHNAILFPEDFKGEAVIIFGISGYAELPKTLFWKKSIEIPSDRILITSTKVEDIPSTIQYSFRGGSKVNSDTIEWNPNFEYDCIMSESKVKAWLFSSKGNNSPVLTDRISELCNDIAKKKMSSFYKSEHSPIMSDNKGKYLWLQGKGLTSLPNRLGGLDIYKAILTNNNFTRLPPQILEINSLEELIMAVNPIREFPEGLEKLPKLKSVSFAETNIKEIKVDLSNLHSVEEFDLARNNLTHLPDQVKNIPNLKWLSLNNNRFTDLSFIDKRLYKLETLYLYSNHIKTLSKETRHLPNLKELLIFDNQLDSIPSNITDLQHLEKLEIWGNPIKYISPEINRLTRLRSMRIDDTYLTGRDKENLKNWLPDCIISYQ